MPRVTTIHFVIKVPISMIRRCNAAIFPPLEKFNILGSNSARIMDAGHHIYLRFL